MKHNFKKIVAAALAVVMGVAAAAVPTYAANATTEPLATIDTSRKGAFTVYKYDFTNAQKDGVWNEDSFVSTGHRESYVETTLGDAIRKGDSDKVSDLGNGEKSNGYAIKGVEFTILNVATITTFTESVNDGHADYNTTRVLYGFSKATSSALLTAIGLSSANAYCDGTSSPKLDNSRIYFEADTLNKALSAALLNNPTKVRNDLEDYIASQAGIKMDETDENGYSRKENLDLGLYLVVETKVPEMVTNTTAPFFVSIPMTTKNGGTNGGATNGGTENTDPTEAEGGHEWNYDVYVYPKNETGIPSLEKTVRESKNDTGKNGGSTSDITDGYKHTATASAGDVVEYQIISTLPNITSKATALTLYKFTDTIAPGLNYTGGDVKIEIFTDAACTSKVATWTQAQTGQDKKFDVSYPETHKMEINITPAGLAEINGFEQGLNAHFDNAAAYANYTMRITYTAKVNSDASSVLGEKGNQNKVVLEWKRSNDKYIDQLIDDCHVYTFGIDLTKKFSDQLSDAATAAGKFEHVKFVLFNETDGYWVTASLDTATGIYYVTGHVATEAEATIFVPQTYKSETQTYYGRIVIRGIEDDSYVLTEVETADGYTLLKDDIDIVIEVEDTDDFCDIYDEDVLGVVQNDARYDERNTTNYPGYLDESEMKAANYPQKHLEHKLLKVKATVDTNDVSMTPDMDTTAAEGKGSTNALVPLTIINQQGLDIPQTGERGMMLFTICGAALMATSLLVVLLAGKKKNEEEEEMN